MYYEASSTICVFHHKDKTIVRPKKIKNNRDPLVKKFKHSFYQMI